ncbi:zinc ion-binding protein [Prunus dulcis]|uniref:Zinc ion-binding protein n=1 Tax=Prunus dulcis TaxID=3755 RepID=A0A4Y1RY86_PRUDU|nr:zinc ion-binding protein [Prunus dulcis]
MSNFVKKFRGQLVRKWHYLVGGKFSIKSWENGEMPWQKQWTTIEAGKIVLMSEILQTLHNYSDGSRHCVKRDALRDSMTSDSPLDSLMSQDSPIEKEPRPIGKRLRRQRKREIARQNGIRIEMEQKRQDKELAIQVEYAEEMEYLRKKDMDKMDRETMAMDTSHMSPETKQFWKLERRDVMRRRLFRDNGLSNTDWLNDGTTKLVGIPFISNS